MSNPLPAVSSGRRFRSSEPGDDAGAALTVREALQLDAVRSGAPEVLAGHGSLGRPIRWVHSGELTTIADSLLGGELLLTTGVAIPVDDAGMRRYVAELAGRSVAGLCIELGGAIATVPSALVEEAERYAVPLVVFHEPVRFVTITEQIHTILVDGRYALLRDVQAAEDELLAIAARGGRLQDMVDALALVLNNPVAVVTASGSPVAAANPPRLDRDAKASWPDLSPRSRAVWEDASLPASPVAPAGSSLVALSDGAVLPPFASQLLARAAQIVTLATAASGATHDRLAQERADVLGDLARSAGGDGAGGLARILTRLRALEFDVSAPRFAPFAVLCAAGEYRDDDAWQRAARTVMSGWRRRGTLIVSHTAAGGLHGVMAVRSEHERSEGADELAALARASLTGDVSTISVVMAQAVTIERLGAELAVAEQSPVDLAGLEPAPWVDSRLLEASRFRWSIRSHAETRQFVGRVLAPFLGPDAAPHAPLVETLRVYCDTLGQKAEAARLLHLNRQSLYARIARIEDLLAVSLDDPETIVTFRLALQLADAQGLRLA
jgi:purine catabolism regulator